MRRILALALGFALAMPAAAQAGRNPVAKAAVHLLPHAERSCSKEFPSITGCEDIVTTYAGCQDIDVFPVFFNLTEYSGMEYGLTWPGAETCAFTSCSDLSIGQIVNSGDGISHAWAACHPDPVAVPGWGWMGAVDYGSICLVDRPGADAIYVGDCDGALDEPIAIFCSGVCGNAGDDPCGGVILPLGLAKDDALGGECVHPGDSLTYTISYDNLANFDDARNVLLVDYLPAEADYVTALPAGAYDSGLHTVTWDLGTVASGSSGDVAVVAQVDFGTGDGTMLTNTCEITSDETPPNDITIYTEVCAEQFVPLTLSKSDGMEGACVCRGQNLTYTISYANFGNTSDVHDVVLIDHLSPDVEYVTSSDDGVYSAVLHRVAWDLGTIGPDGGGSSGVIVHVPEETWPGTLLENTCDITSLETPPEELTIYTEVCEGDFTSLTLDKDDGLGAVCVDGGDTVTYTISYGNLFNTEAGVATGQTLYDVCWIYSDETDTTETTEGTDVCGAELAPLNIAKTDASGGSCVERGQQLIYTITYDNTTNVSAVHNVILVDKIPTYADFWSATDGGVYDPGSREVTWNIGTLEVDQMGSRGLIVKVKQSVPSWSMLRNEARIAGDGTPSAAAIRNTTVCGSHGNPDAKVAVHVMDHASRTCTKDFPVITQCGEIVYEIPGSDVDAFPVFFDLIEYQGFDYGFHWPGTYSCAFTSCSDLTIGAIVNPGDGISHAWSVCRPGPTAIPGWGWILEPGPALVCVIEHPTTQTINIGDCLGEIGQPLCSFCAGIAGAHGDRPCAPINIESTKWGAIKAMYK
jgi:uncharacterized repeat protein (TIGR01451 family)